MRYSAVTSGFIAVSELATRCTCRVAGKMRLKATSLLLLLLLISGSSGASTVSAEIDYQIFRDFAENKGMFHPGATDIAIYNKQGELVGTLNKAAMPDFSAVSRSGIATLINPQYVASVKHNGAYTYGKVTFGDGRNRYNIVDRNEHDSVDFHAPRLDKLVTEVVPATVTSASKADIMDSSKFSAFYRLGMGNQYIQDTEGNEIKINNAYYYLTGGTLPASPRSEGTNLIRIWVGDNVNDLDVMASLGQAGDSGSPLFGWNETQGQWELTGVYKGTWDYGWGNIYKVYVVIPQVQNFLSQVCSEDYDDPVVFNSSVSSPLYWTFDSDSGTGALTQGNTTYDMHGQKESDLNAGKNLIFQGGNGLVDLKNPVLQGAGSLTFRDDYTVTTTNGSTWTGAGIIVDKDASVTWQVNGVKDDNLHKIGEGTLIVQGYGVNEGGLKVGDGTVVLSQQPDDNGQVQAFSSVNIASGRPTVVLSDDRQVNPDTVSWGYQGGTLDVNGNSLIFHQLKAADYGAVLANNSDRVATITLDGSLTASEVVLNTWSYSGDGMPGDLYEYDNPYTNTTDYFILKQVPSPYGYFPTDQSSDATWEFVGHSRDDAQKWAADNFNATGYRFLHGQLKGNLDVDNRLSEDVTGALVMDGSADMSGTFTQENGRLTLQGHPVIHAYNSQTVVDKLAASGDYSVLTQPTSFSQEDWESRSFTFDRLSLKKGSVWETENIVR